MAAKKAKTETKVEETKVEETKVEETKVEETKVKEKKVETVSDDVVIDSVNIAEWKEALGLRGTSGKLYKATWKEVDGKVIISK